MEIIDYFSPNFDRNKRSKRKIKVLVIHYTGMQSERESLNRLCNSKLKVSCHYLINRKGRIFRLVQDNDIAWHAGKSCWSKYKNLNHNSIGIELTNKGHRFGYTNFTQKQISQLLALSNKLIKKHKIYRKNIVGHSDIAPTRKIDPGEKFPWKYLSKNKIGIWHNLEVNLLKKFRRKKVQKKRDKKKFIKDLNKIGYCIRTNANKFVFGKTVRAFQRHFRNDVINGLLDIECSIIASNLAQRL